MSRDDGFEVMDVAVGVFDDAKFRRLARAHPECLAAAGMVFIAVLGASWRHGRRVTVDDGWPALLPFDETVVGAMREVRLLDPQGRIAAKSWRGWYIPAKRRRDTSRARWARYNEKRDADTAPQPRGNDAATATSVPSFRPSSLPTVRAPRKGTPRKKRDDGEGLNDAFRRQGLPVDAPGKVGAERKGD